MRVGGTLVGNTDLQGDLAPAFKDLQSSGGDRHERNNRTTTCIIMHCCCESESRGGCLFPEGVAFEPESEGRLSRAFLGNVRGSSCLCVCV